MGAPRRLSASPQLELFRSGPDRHAEPRPTPTSLPLRAHRYLEGDAASIRVGNEWLDELLKKRGLGWVIELQVWLRKRVVQHAGDPSLRFPAALLQCQATGTRPLSPLALLSAVLVGSLLGITSLRGLEQWAAADLRATWLLGGFTPDHSTFGRFILRMQGCVSEELFERLTEEALREVGKSIRDVSVDGTTIQAAASRYGRLSAEAVGQQLAEARTAATRAPKDPESMEALRHAEACASALAQRQQMRRDNRQDPDTVTVCPADLEAVVHKLKEGGFAPAVIASVVATDDRFAVAAEIHATDEIEVVASMLDQAERMAAAVNATDGRTGGCEGKCAPPPMALVPPAACALDSIRLCDARCAVVPCDDGRAQRSSARARLGACGIEVARADGNYLKGVVLREEEARGIELRIALGSLSGSALGPQAFDPEDRKAFDKPRFRLVVLPANEYAPERSCMQCPMGALLTLVSHDSGRPGDPAHDVYRAVGVRCSVCPYKARCAPETARRRVARYPDDELKERMRERLAAAPRGAHVGLRAKSVEPVFSVVKGVQGLRRFRRRGLSKARVEWHLHLVAHNLRRMMSLAGWRKAS